MSDEYELMTSVPHGHDAFWILNAPRPIEKAPPKRSHKRTRTKAEQSAYAFLSDEERAAYRIEIAKKSAATRIARKNVSAFNVAIASADDSRKTQSIKGKL